MKSTASPNPWWGWNHCQAQATAPHALGQAGKASEFICSGEKVGRNRLVSVVVFESADFYTICSFWVNDDRTEERVSKLDNRPSFEWSWKIFSNPYSRHKEGMLVFHWLFIYLLCLKLCKICDIWRIILVQPAKIYVANSRSPRPGPQLESPGADQTSTQNDAKCRSSSISSISISQKLIGWKADCCCPNMSNYVQFAKIESWESSTMSG